MLAKICLGLSLFHTIFCCLKVGAKYTPSDHILTKLNPAQKPNLH